MSASVSTPFGGDPVDDTADPAVLPGLGGDHLMQECLPRRTKRSRMEVKKGEDSDETRRLCKADRMGRSFDPRNRLSQLAGEGRPPVPGRARSGSKDALARFRGHIPLPGIGIHESTFLPGRTMSR